MPVGQAMSGVGNTAAAPVGAVGGILAADMNRSAATAAGDAQKAAITQMIAKLDAVGMPPDQSAKLILDQYKQAGTLTPALEAQIGQQVSAYQSIKADPSTRNMQVQALQRMSQMGQAGLTADERAQQRLLQGQAQQQNTANQQSIIQNMQARGQAGGGAELAARLGSSQNAANTGSAAADQVSAMAQQRALQAIAQGSSMAGQLNQQDFGQAATIAGASDQMNRFNTQNQMAINQRNTQAANQAQAANLANAQQIGNANVAQTNQEQYAALQRQRQNWQDKMQYAGAYANPLAAYGNAAAGQAMGEGQARSQGISGGFGALASMMGGGQNSGSNSNPFGSYSSGSNSSQGGSSSPSPGSGEIGQEGMAGADSGAEMALLA